MRKLVLSLLPLFTVVTVMAQQVSYSQPQKDDYKNTEFEIIGKVGQNILVYTDFRNTYVVSAYDDNMALKEQATLEFLPPGELINVDFVAFSDRYMVFYQFQHKKWVYCYGAMLDADSKLIGNLQFIDSTDVGMSQVKTRLYSVVVSDNKSRIMVYKINQSKEDNNVFYTFLMDNQLRLVNNSRVELKLDSKKDYLSNFVLDDSGEFLFAKLESSTKYSLDHVSIVSKPAQQDTFYVHDIDLQRKYLDEVKLKLDDRDHQVYIASYFYNERRSDVNGLFFAKLDWAADSMLQQKFIVFGQDLKVNAKDEYTEKAAFDDYFIKQLILTGDGGVLVISESFYTTSAGGPWDRWDYLYGPGAFSPSYYYSPFSPWYSPYSTGNSYETRYYYNNIAIFSYDPAGNLRWSNFIHKNQFDDDNDALLSYQLVNTGETLHFVFNAPFRRTFILNDVSAKPDGKLDVLPTLRGLDQGYQWMPRYGKQISSWQLVVPCIYRNYICFAKIDY